MGWLCLHFIVGIVGGPGGDEWGENMIGGPHMRGRGRVGIPMRGGGLRGPPPGVPGGPPMGPPMRGGRGGRIRQGQYCWYFMNTTD